MNYNSIPEGPRIIYADRLRVFVAKAINEMERSETAIFEHEHLFRHPDEEFAEYQVLIEELKQYLDDLSHDRMTGDSAVEKMRVDIFKVHYELVQNMIESDQFPEVLRLHEVCH